MDMPMLHENLLSLITFTPLAGAALLYLLPLRSKQDPQCGVARFVGLVVTLITFLLSYLIS